MARERFLFGGLNRGAPYFANARGKGLHAYAFDEESGAATLLCEATGIDNPTYLSLSPDGRFVYANSEVFGWPEGAVSACRCDVTVPRLRPINRQPSLGSITAHSSFDRTRRFLVYPVRQDGRLAPPVASVAHEGSGPNAARQERPHPHCVLASPDNRFIIVADLGLDALIAYRFDRTVISTKQARCAARCRRAAARGISLSTPVAASPSSSARSTRPSSPCAITATAAAST